MAKFNQVTAQRIHDLAFNPDTNQDEFVEAYFVDAGGGMVFTSSDANGMFIRIFTTADITADAAKRGLTLFDSYSRMPDGSIEWSELTALVGTGPTKRFLLPSNIAKGLGVL